MSESISIQDFVLLLWNSFPEVWKSTGKDYGSSKAELLRYGHVRGWVEDQDEVNCNSSLDKRTAARIVHQFMKIELQTPDEPSITKAESLKDLYTCRVCANHIAQIYLKGIMDAEEFSHNGETALIFNSTRTLSFPEAQFIIDKLHQTNPVPHFGG